MPSSKQALLPALAVIAIVGGAAAALLKPDPAPERAALPASASAQTAEQGAPLARATTGELVEGTVRERIEVGQYIYLKLDREGAGETWTAVSKAPVELGERVRLRDTQLMTNFTSPKLKRTFDRIYFGVLDKPGGSAAVPQPLPKVHGDSPHGDPHSGLSGMKPAAAVSSSGAPHPAPFSTAQPVKVGSVPRAKGPRGRTVEQVHQQREQLKGQPVRVRGVVVKSMSGVLGKNFVHLRDGSGSDEITRDLTVTTQSEHAVGSEALFEGTVVADKDFGAGYRYPVLLEDARVVSE